MSVKEKQIDPLKFTNDDIVNFKSICSLALIGCKTDRENLSSVLLLENNIIKKIQKAIKAK